jgi:(p)ppGpp synthase/HD superfamily hydrolase
MNKLNRFEEALVYASQAHAGQVRKSTNIPYLSHLMGVAGIALENGATEDEAIGALLHDTAEDAGGRPRLEDVRQKFGTAVAAIVEGCTDTFETPKPAWRPRKEAYIAHLAQATPSITLVSASDKLHNARCILADCRQTGDAVWTKFNGGKEGTLWYYRALADKFLALRHDPLAQELDRVVRELERLSGGKN